MVFVTGGTGLLGSHLLRALLQKGKTIKALYREKLPANLTKDELARIEWIKGDIFDTELLQEICSACEEVYHCAGLVSFNPSRKKELFHVNVTGTANLVNACIESRIRKLVHVSSVAAIGRKRDNMTVTEEEQWNENNNSSTYGKSKFLGELEVWRGIGEGLNAVIVNPVIILGVGDWQDGSAATFKNAYDEFPWYAEGVSGFVDAADVATCMISLMEKEISGERFIISAENRSFREIFNVMADAFGKKRPTRKVSPFLAGIVWRIEKIKSLLSGGEPLLTKETADTAQTKVYFENSKILRALPEFKFKPMADTITEACLEYVQMMSKKS